MNVPSAPLLQGVWENLREQKEILTSPYLPSVCALMTHLVLCAPFFALDALGSVCPRLASCRISAASEPPPSLRQWGDCFWRLLSNYLSTVLPAGMLFQSLRTIPTFPQLAPSCWQLFVEVFACFLLFDLLFFLWHYSMHR